MDKMTKAFLIVLGIYLSLYVLCDIIEMIFEVTI